MSEFMNAVGSFFTSEAFKLGSFSVQWWLIIAVILFIVILTVIIIWVVAAKKKRKKVEREKAVKESEIKEVPMSNLENHSNNSSTTTTTTTTKIIKNNQQPVQSEDVEPASETARVIVHDPEVRVVSDTQEVKPVPEIEQKEPAPAPKPVTPPPAPQKRYVVEEVITTTVVEEDGEPVINETKKGGQFMKKTSPDVTPAATQNKRSSTSRPVEKTPAPTRNTTIKSTMRPVEKPAAPKPVERPVPPKVEKATPASNLSDAAKGDNTAPYILTFRSTTNEWLVKRRGSEKILKTYRKWDDALAEVKGYAKRQGVGYVTYQKDGSIRFTKTKEEAQLED
ncbi:MAG: DUF2188 domain-containing protein [Erysipelotrichaceae bacterium]|jgi:FtsZ-interacting cell division protein ZipA|nr:DUF2188 domain-containing protein [Erysipelotrichaceae bacterium]